MSGIQDFGRNGITPWDTRFRPLPVPTEGIFDEPTASICINVKWLAHIDGLLSRLLWLDAWKGDRETQLIGVGEVVKLMASLIERNPCGDEMTLRPSPEDCKILQIFEGGEWVTFWDLNGCVVDGTNGIDGQDGASPEMRVSGGYIQWRQDDDSPTWTNLIAISALIGPQGVKGDTGDPGLQGFKGEKGDTGSPGTGGNVYPAKPTAAQSVALCNAATYVVEQIRNLIVDVYTQLDTIQPGEVFQALLNQNGWSVGSLYDLIAFAAGSLANEMTNLAAFDAAKDDLICELITQELNKGAVVSWVDTTYSGQATLRDMLKHALNAASENGQYATWVAVGATMTTADCSDCNPVVDLCGPAWPMPIAFYQGTITNVTGSVYSVSLVTDPVPGYRIIRSSNYGNWSKGNFELTHVEIIGGTPQQLYVERNNGSVLYNGTNVAALNALLPACIRYFQAVKHTSTTEFSVKMTIIN